MASSINQKCVICNKSLGKDDKPELTTECDHTFHLKCVSKRFYKKQKMRCKVCHKESALANALELWKQEQTMSRESCPDSRRGLNASFANLYQVSCNI